jgi:hypothetical protein
MINDSFSMYYLSKFFTVFLIIFGLTIFFIHFIISVSISIASSRITRITMSTSNQFSNDILIVSVATFDPIRSLRLYCRIAMILQVNLMLFCHSFRFINSLVFEHLHWLKSTMLVSHSFPIYAK